jgi:hypothetical protein
MAISEAARADLYNGLTEAIGPQRAETLMSAIPLHDLDEVATKADLAILRAELKAELAELRSELRSQISGEVGSLRKSMTTWMLTILVAIIASLIGVGFLG